jgi:lipoprotein NlpD
MPCLHAVRADSCVWALLAALALTGCASSRYQAPVEDRGANAQRANAGTAASMAAAPGSVPAVPASGDPNARPGAENAGKPGYYTIKPGDTLIRVGLETGQNWRDIARWNGIDNANLIEIGQVLRVAPPGVDAAGTAARGVAASKVDARPLDAKPAPAASAPGGATSAAGVTLPAITTTVPTPAPVMAAATPATAPREPDDDISWMWPAAGPVVAGFDEARNKGLSIVGKAGDPVLAAADGRVVYAGSGLRGYGNLVIVKHNNTYLTAYAHNQALLVKEDQVVRRGQKIAEMGSSEADRVQLHFEIRRQGRPIDPARLLPQR